MVTGWLWYLFSTIGVIAVLSFLPKLRRGMSSFLSAFGKIRPMYWGKLGWHAPVLVPHVAELIHETAHSYTPQQVFYLFFLSSFDFFTLSFFSNSFCV